MMLTDINIWIAIVLGATGFITAIFAIPTAWSNLKDKVFNLENTVIKLETILTNKIDKMQNSIDILNIHHAQITTTMDLIKKKLEL